MNTERAPRRGPPLWLAFFAIGLAVLLAVWWITRSTGGDDLAPVTEMDSASRAEAARDDAQTDPARGGVASFEQRVSKDLGPRVAARAMRGGLRINAQRLDWREPAGPRFLQASRATGVLDLSAFKRGDIVVDQVELRDPVVNVSKPTTAAQWNYERLIQPGESDGAGRLLAFRNIRIFNGAARVELPDGTYMFRSATGVVALAEFATPGDRPRRVDVSSLTAMLTLSDTSAAVPVTVADAALRLTDTGMTFDVARGAWGTGRLSAIEGAWEFGGPGLNITASGRADEFLLADARAFMPTLPAEGSASFRFSVSPASGGRMRIGLSDLDARSGESRISGSLQTIIGADQPPELGSINLRLDPVQLSLLESISGRTLPYAGTLRGTVSGEASALRFDVGANLIAKETREMFSARLSGTAALSGTGFQLASMDANLDEVPLQALSAFFPGLPLEGFVSGRVRLAGPLGTVPLQVDLNLTVAGGTALVQGTVDTRGDVPSYDLRGELIRVQLEQLLQPAVPPVALSARFAARGSGFELATAVSRVELFGRFTGWRTGPRDSVGVILNLARGTMDLDTLGLRMGPISAAAGGTWHFVAPATGGIRYALEVRSLEDVSAYIPRSDSIPAEGVLRARGALSGTFADLRFGGVVEGQDIQYGQWAAQSVGGEYAYIGAGEYPEVDLDIQATGVETPAGNYDEITIDGRLANQFFTVDVQGARTGGGGIEFVADGQLGGDAGSRAVIRSLAADLQDQRWALTDTAVVSWGGPGLHVANFVVQQTNGTGIVRIDGRIPPQGDSELDVAVRALPVADVLRLLGRDHDVQGLLTADAEVRGTRAAPVVNMTFGLDQGFMNGVALSSSEGRFNYAGGRSLIDLAMLLADGGSMELNAQLPSTLELTFPPKFVLDTLSAMSGTFVASDMPAALIAQFYPGVEEVAGTMNGRVAISGSMTEPLLDGQLTLADGQATVVMLDQQFTEIAADVLLESRLITVRSLHARADGYADLTGTIALEDLANPEFDLVATLTDFEPIGAEEVDGAGFSGTVEIAGPLNALNAGGRLEVEDGTIPLSTFLQSDRLLTPRSALLEEEPLGEAEFAAQPTGPSWLENLTLDGLVVDIREGVWFAAEDVRARLQGELTLYKEGMAVRVFGTLTGNQGTFTMAVGPLVRRFEVETARVRFFGTAETNPSIDITASRTILSAAGRVQVLIIVSGTIDAPTVALSTPDGTIMPESELLNVLVFGQTNANLDVGIVPGQELAQELLFSGLLDYAGMEAEEALLEEVGIPVDYFLIRSQAVSTVGGLFDVVPTVVVGKQLTNDIFLTLESGTQNFADAWLASLEWQIDRQWSVQLNSEPSQIRQFRGFSADQFFAPPRKRQFSLDLRRRWTY